MYSGGTEPGDAVNPAAVAVMAEAGVDNIIVHFGNSSGGSIGSQTVMGLDAMVERYRTVYASAMAR